MYRETTLHGLERTAWLQDLLVMIEERVGRGEPADAQPGDDDAQPGPGGVAVGQPADAVGAVGSRGEVLAHQAPTTHSA